MPYDSSDIIGKKLYAKVRVPLKRIGWDYAPVVTYVEPGQLVGTVFSFLESKPGRVNLYWMFQDEGGNAYYAEHKQGLFDLDRLRAQGVLTTEEKEQSQLFRDAKKLLGQGVVVFVGTKLAIALIHTLRNG